MTSLLLNIKSIRGRLALVLIIFVVVMVMLAMAGRYFDNQRLQAARNQVRTQLISTTLLAAHRESLDGFAHAMIFRANKDKMHAKGARQSYAQALEVFEITHQVVDQTRFWKTIELSLIDLRLVVELLDQYFDLIERVGLTENIGLEGEMRAFASKLEQTINVPDLAHLLLELRRREKDFILRGERKYVDLFDSQYRLISQKMNERNSPQALVDDFAAYSNSFHNLASTIDQREEVFSQFLDVHERRSAKIENVIAQGQVIIAEASQRAVQTQSIIDSLISVVFPSAVFLIVLLQGYFSRSIDKGIQTVVSAINETVAQLEQGGGCDVRMKGNIAMRELNTVADAFNRLMNILEELLRQISEVSGNMQLVSSDTQESATQNNRSIQQQVAEIGALSASIGRMSEAATAMADTTHTASEMVRETDETARQGLQVMDDAMAINNAVANEINRTSGIAQEMERMGTEVGAVMTVINNITDQTSLLALNAAIEAARAGEVGRGFAVVADEVRTLAMKTSAATKSIKVTVEGVQAGILQLVSAMDISTGKVTQSVEKNHEVQEVLERIVGATDKLAAVNKRVASTAKLQSQESADIRSNIIRIETVAGNIADSTMKATSDSGDLSQFSTILSNLVDRISGRQPSKVANPTTIATATDDVELF